MQIERVDSFEPDWGRQCENCGQVPTVTALKNGEVIHESRLCGPCTWGERATSDPSTWNAQRSA